MNCDPVAVCEGYAFDGDGDPNDDDAYDDNDAMSDDTDYEYACSDYYDNTDHHAACVCVDDAFSVYDGPYDGYGYASSPYSAYADNAYCARAGDVGAQVLDEVYAL